MNRHRRRSSTAAGIAQYNWYSTTGNDDQHLWREGGVDHAETYGHLLETAFTESEGLGSSSTRPTLKAYDDTVGDSQLCEQFRQIVKLIDLRTHRSYRRARPACSSGLTPTRTSRQCSIPSSPRPTHASPTVAEMTQGHVGERRDSLRLWAHAHATDAARITRGRAIRWCCAAR